MATHRRNLTSAALGAAVGALDGYGASRDTDAGRSWNSPGIGATGPLVLSWGYAPAVQVGSAILGTAMIATGHDAGRGPLLMGIGLMARAGTLKLAQRRQTTPANVQGYAAPRALVAGMSAEVVHGPLGGQQRTTSVG